MGVIFNSTGSAGGYPCEAPDDLYERCMEATPKLPVVPWFGNANRFIHPIGCSRPGYGAVLLKRKYLYALPSAVQQYKVKFDASFSDGTTDTRTFRNLRIVGTPICVTPGVPQDDDATMFVELADRRIDCVGLCGKRYNWRIHPDSTYETASLNTGVAWTWTTLLTDLWNAVGNLGTLSTLPVTPAGTPEQIDGMACRAADLLDDLLMLCGMGVAYDTEEDTFSVVSFSANATTFIGRRLSQASLGAVGQKIIDRQDRVIWDQEPVADNLPKLPAYVRVAFPVWSPGGTPIDTASYYIVDVADATPDATRLTASAFVLIQDFFVCRTNQVGTALNSANLISRAADVANNWYAQARKGSFYPYHQTFSGIGGGTVVVPGAAIDVMCWEDVGDGAKTHIIQTGRLGFPPMFHDTPHIAGQMMTGNPFGVATNIYRYPVDSANQADPIQRGANIPPGELRTYGTGPFAAVSGNTAATYAGGGGMSSIMQRVGPLRQWDSAIEARSVDGHGQRLWLAKKRVQHFCFVKVTSTTPSVTPTPGLYPAIEQLIEPISKTSTNGDVCWFYDPNSTAAPGLNAIHLAYLDGTDGAGTPKKIYIASSGTTINVVTNVCPTFSSGGFLTGFKTEYTPIAAIRVGPTFCESNPTGCCPCPSAPNSVTFKLTSSCADLNNVSITLAYNSTTNEWYGTATTAASIVVAIHLIYTAGVGWTATLFYNGLLAATFTGTVLSCSPFDLSLALAWTSCLQYGGTGAFGTYTFNASASGPTGGVSSPCCPAGDAPPVQLCLTTSILSGTCNDLNGQTVTLTNSGGNAWTTSQTWAFCLSPFRSGCAVLNVSPQIVCDGSQWLLQWASPGRLPVTIGTIPLPGICTTSPMNFDVVFDSTDATFPPTLNHSCCNATVRFAVSNGQCLAVTSCCPGGLPNDLEFVVTGGTAYGAAKISWNGTLWTGSGTFACVGVPGPTCSCGTQNVALSCSGGVWTITLAGGSCNGSKTPPTSAACSPASIVFDVSGFIGGAGSIGTVTAGVSTTCCANGLPSVVHVSGNNGMATTLSYIGNLPGGNDTWTGNSSDGFIQMACGNAGGWSFAITTGPHAGDTITLTASSCSPFVLTFTDTITGTVYTVTP